MQNLQKIKQEADRLHEINVLTNILDGNIRPNNLSDLPSKSHDNSPILNNHSIRKETNMLTAQQAKQLSEQQCLTNIENNILAATKQGRTQTQIEIPEAFQRIQCTLQELGYAVKAYQSNTYIVSW